MNIGVIINQRKDSIMRSIVNNCLFSISLLCGVVVISINYDNNTLHSIIIGFVIACVGIVSAIARTKIKGDRR